MIKATAKLSKGHLMLHYCNKKSDYAESESHKNVFLRKPGIKIELLTSICEIQKKNKNWRCEVGGETKTKKTKCRE
jgi:hypothetical protein